MNIFLVSQNPDSKYNDVEGQHYDYPTSIPNGKQIKVGDCLIFVLSSKLFVMNSFVFSFSDKSKDEWEGPTKSLIKFHRCCCSAAGVAKRLNQQNFFFLLLFSITQSASALYICTL